MARRRKGKKKPQPQRDRSGRRACVFCGKKTELTREHAWPRWIGEVLPIDERTVPHHVGENPPWDAPPWSMTVRHVCKDCNHGWMSNLETTAKPLLAPMMLGQSIALSEADQRLVATWAVKTAMMLELTVDESTRAIPRTHYRWVRKHKKPPGPCQVVLARYATIVQRGDAIQVHIERMGHYNQSKLRMAEPSGRLTHGYGATITIGQLALQVLGFNRPQTQRIHRTPVSPGFYEEIWRTSRPVSWPPRLALDEKALDVFARAFLSE